MLWYLDFRALVPEALVGNALYRPALASFPLSPNEKWGSAAERDTVGAVGQEGAWLSGKGWSFSHCSRGVQPTLNFLLLPMLLSGLWGTALIVPGSIGHLCVRFLSGNV